MLIKTVTISLTGLRQTWGTLENVSTTLKIVFQITDIVWMTDLLNGQPS